MLFKQISLVSFGLLIVINSYSQKFSVAADKMNVMYIGTTNPLTIAVENTPCNSLEVTIDNGTIEKTGDCEYTAIPKNPGEAIVKVFKITGRAKISIGESKFRAKWTPDPVAMFDGRHKGFLSKSILCEQQVLVALYPNYDYDPGFEIVHCTITITRNGRVIYSKDFISARFDDELKKELCSLEGGEAVTVDNIHVKGREGSDRELESINIIVKN